MEPSRYSFFIMNYKECQMYTDSRLNCNHSQSLLLPKFLRGFFNLDLWLSKNYFTFFNYRLPCVLYYPIRWVWSLYNEYMLLHIIELIKCNTYFKLIMTIQSSWRKFTVWTIRNNDYMLCISEKKLQFTFHCISISSTPAEWSM